MLKNHHCITFFFIPRLDCHQKVTASPFQGVATEQKSKNRKIHSHSHSLITTAQALLGTPGEVQPDRVSVQPFGHHRSGHTQDPRQDSTVTNRVPPEVPDPPSYRVESVDFTWIFSEIKSNLPSPRR